MSESNQNEYNQIAFPLDLYKFKPCFFAKQLKTYIFGFQMETLTTSDQCFQRFLRQKEDTGRFLETEPKYGRIAWARKQPLS